MQMELQENTVCYTKALCENDINCFFAFWRFPFLHKSQKNAQII